MQYGQRGCVFDGALRLNLYIKLNALLIHAFYSLLLLRVLMTIFTYQLTGVNQSLSFVAMGDFTDPEGFRSPLVPDTLQNGRQHIAQLQGREIPNMFGMNGNDFAATQHKNPAISNTAGSLRTLDIATNNQVCSTNTLGIFNHIQDFRDVSHFSSYNSISIPFASERMLDVRGPESLFHVNNQFSGEDHIYSNYLQSNTVPSINYMRYDMIYQMPTVSPRSTSINTYERHTPGHNLNQDSVEIPRVEINKYHGDPVSSTLVSKPSSTTRSKKGTASRSKSSRNINLTGEEKATSACVSCKFANTTCTFRPGSGICSRCESILNKKVPTINLTVSEIIFFEITQAQILLAAVRGMCQQAARWRQLLGETPFSPVILYLDDSEVFNHYSDRPEPIVITQFSTTPTATKRANGGKVPPALHRGQLNKFVDGQIYRALGSVLYTANKGIIQRAQRCAAFLAILYNIDNSRVHEAPHSSIEESQNFVLETLYSIVYEIQELINDIGHEVKASTQKPADYAQALCALYLLFRSINSHSELVWTTSHLEPVHKFFNGFHDRTPYALKVLKGAKAVFGARHCSVECIETSSLENLIEKQSKFCPVITATYEKTSTLYSLQNNAYQVNSPRSLVQILETGVGNESREDDWFDGLTPDHWAEEQLNLLAKRLSGSRISKGNNRRKRKCDTVDETPSKKHQVSHQLSPFTDYISNSTMSEVGADSYTSEGTSWFPGMEIDTILSQLEPTSTAGDVINSTLVSTMNEDFQWPVASSDYVSNIVECDDSWAYDDSVDYLGLTKDHLRDLLLDPVFQTGPAEFN
ncbi:hypothetical protein F5884DRAFT_777551 [Xylogone sp. PMI_703]|nr:hypothetical protein F5884DRAFT_777551 [Xylogone sp. PMI_703]